MNYISTKTRKFTVMVLAVLSLLAVIDYPPAWAEEPEKPNVKVCGECGEQPCKKVATTCGISGHHECDKKDHTNAGCGHLACSINKPSKHAGCVCGGGYICDTANHGDADCQISGHRKCDGDDHSDCECGSGKKCESGHGLRDCQEHRECDTSSLDCTACGCGGGYNCQIGHGPAECQKDGHLACDGDDHEACDNPKCGKHKCECDCHKCSDCDSYDVTECPHSCGNGMGSVSGDKVYHCDTHMCNCTYDQSGDDCSYDGQTSFTYKAGTYGASFDVSSLIKVKTGTSAKCQCGESGPNGKHTIKFSPQTVDMTSAASQKADKVYSIKVSCEDCSFTKTVKITNKHVCAFGHSACTYVKLSGGKSSFIHHPDGREEEVVANVAIKSPINLSAEVYECCQYCHKKGQTLSGTWAGVNGSKIQFNKVGTDKQVLYVDSNNRNNAFGGLKFNVYCDAHEPGSVTVTPHDTVLCDTVPDGNGWMAQGSFNAKLEKCAKCGKDEFNSFSTKWTISGATPSKTSGQGLSTGTINFRGFDSGSVKFTAKATGSSSSSVEVSGEEHFKVEHTHNWVGATNQSWRLIAPGRIMAEPKSSDPILIKVGDSWNETPDPHFTVDTMPASYKRLKRSCSKCHRKEYEINTPALSVSFDWENVKPPKTYTKNQTGEKTFTARFTGESIIDNVVQNSYQTTADKSAYVWNIDLKIDSDNSATAADNGINDADDSVENVAPGKHVFINNLDKDKDGVPDFADGFNSSAGVNSGAGASPEFTPLKLKFDLPNSIDASTAKVKFTYLSSDPATVTKTGNGTDASPLIYTPASGHLRIWEKDGTESRFSEPIIQNGDFIPANVQFSLETFAYQNELEFYIEAVKESSSKGDLSIKVELDIDGDGIFDAEDKVRLTVFKVIEVHPLDADFTPGKEGRVMISTKHDNAYYTTVKTTKADGVAQTADHKVTVSAYIEPKLADVEVFFEVVDPDDKSPYEGKNVPGDPEDKKPNDNRDSNRTMKGGTESDYNNFQGCLSARSAKTEIKTINGVERAVAEIILTFTDRYSGDNYRVRASCQNPESKPFDAISGTSGSAPKTTDVLASSSTLVAWKRVYLERDNMYKLGATIITAFTADADSGNDFLDVDNTGDFTAPSSSGPGSSIQIFTSTGNIYNRTVLGITGNRIEVADLPDDLPQYSGVKLASNNTVFTIVHDLDHTYGLLTDGTDGGCFVEFVDNFKGSGNIPKYTEFPNNGDLTVAFPFCEHWRRTVSNFNNICQLVAANLHQDTSFGTGNPNGNTVFVTVTQADSTHFVNVTTSHEIGHYLRLKYGDNGHVDNWPTDGVKDDDHIGVGTCIMDYDKVDTDGEIEFCIKCIYQVRDAVDPR